MKIKAPKANFQDAIINFSLRLNLLLEYVLHEKVRYVKLGMVLINELTIFALFNELIFEKMNFPIKYKFKFRNFFIETKVVLLQHVFFTENLFTEILNNIFNKNQNMWFQKNHFQKILKQSICKTE